MKELQKYKDDKNEDVQDEYSLANLLVVISNTLEQIEINTRK